MDQVDTVFIKAASARGLAISGVAQVIRFAIQFVSSVLMARLLVPADYGLVAMAAPLVAFVQLLAELGLGQATVQRASISQRELSFLFWIGLATSVVIGGIVIVTAPLAASFYHEPRVTGVVVALGTIVMMSGAYAQHTALLNRTLRFGAIAAIEVSSFLLAALAGVTAAWGGCSYWAIVISQLVASVTMLFLTWWFARWIPGLPRRIDTARVLLGFGGDLTAFNVANFFARNLDNVLIGRFSGEGALGLYDRAYKLLLFPLAQITAPISKVANPILARSLADTEFYRNVYFRLLDAVLLMTYPLAIFCGIGHSGLIRVVLGPQWSGASPIFAVLAIGALFAPIGNSTSWLLVTQGRTAELRNYGILSSIAFVVAIVVGLRWGPLGVATSYIAVGVIQGPLLWWATMRLGPVGLTAFVKNLSPYIIASLPAAALNLIAVKFVPATPFTLFVALLATYAIFLLPFLALPARRRVLAPYYNECRRLLRRAGLSGLPIPHRSKNSLHD